MEIQNLSKFIKILEWSKEIDMRFSLKQLGDSN